LDVLWIFLMETHNRPDPHPVDPPEKQAELKRVLDSKYFTKAPRRKLFLEFISDRASKGEGEKLNEYLIGVEVYERGSDFDPQQDPIVRVQAYEIRRALKTYYENEGRNSPLRLELPLGQYAPLFSRVKAEGGGSPAPAIGEESFAKAAGQESARWRVILPVCLGLACVVLGYLFVRERAISRRLPAAGTVLPETEEWFWKPFLSSGSQPLVVVSSTPALRLATGHESTQTLKEACAIPKSKLSRFRDTPHFQELESFAFVPSTTDYTGMGEALGLVSLSRLFASQGAMIRVKPSRLADYTEIQGGNTIMLGGANRWTNRSLFNPQEFSASLSEGVITNDRPRPGEESVYAPKFDPVTGGLVRDYALVVMQPNRNEEERLLRLDGIFTQGTEAAAEYVTNPESLAELRKALLAASSNKKNIPRFFEALLSVPVENFVPGGASLVTVKVIPE
jgi:hypothetical protein